MTRRFGLLVIAERRPCRVAAARLPGRIVPVFSRVAIAGGLIAIPGLIAVPQLVAVVRLVAGRVGTRVVPVRAPVTGPGLFRGGRPILLQGFVPGPGFIIGLITVIGRAFVFGLVAVV
jgi:hypothetical protein